MIADGKIKKNLDRAVELILAGEIVAFPTETVYGLGADALRTTALEKIFKAKGRPFEDPLIVHVADLDQVSEVALPLVGREKEIFEKLTKKFWPGALSLILPRSKNVPDRVTAGKETVALRMPRHLIARALIKNSGRPIAAPSANRFQSISPTTALAVEKELGENVSLILDGGPCQVGVESTVLSLVGDPRILRPGGISREDIESVLGFSLAINAKTKAKGGGLMAPGMLEFHYAPQKPLKIYEVEDLEKFAKGRGAKKTLAKAALLCFSKQEQKIFAKAGFAKIHVLSSCGNLDEAARQLFGTLRLIDESSVEKIFVLKCPDERLGQAINDRLMKAEHDS